MSDERYDIELLMNRRLDGNISEEESLVLDRALLRDPQLRATFEAYARNDVWAAAALKRELGYEGTGVDLTAITHPGKLLRMRRPHRGWLLIPGAIAAALLALVVPVPKFGPAEPVVEPSRPVISEPVAEHSMAPIPALDRNSLYRQASTTRRNTGRDVMGVVGSDGNIYWIEVDRTRTVTLPKPSFAGPDY